jgi:hypothetical protein
MKLKRLSILRLPRQRKAVSLTALPALRAKLALKVPRVTQVNLEQMAKTEAPVLMAIRR